MNTPGDRIAHMGLRAVQEFRHIRERQKVKIGVAHNQFGFGPSNFVQLIKSK